MKHKTKDEIKKIATEQRELIREVRREELVRIEEAARTEDDFKELSKKIWDKLDANRERRERYYVAELENMIIENIEVTDRAVIPQPLNHMWWRQMMGGDFLDVIFDCPYDLHELTSKYIRLRGNSYGDQITVSKRNALFCRKIRVARLHNRSADNTGLQRLSRPAHAGIARRRFLRDIRKRRFAARSAKISIMFTKPELKTKSDVQNFLICVFEIFSQIS